MFASLFNPTQPHMALVPELPPTVKRLSSLLPCGTYQIVAVHSEEAEITLIRLGLGIGDTLELKVRLPHQGPLVLEANGVEFALGFQYASAIDVISL